MRRWTADARDGHVSDEFNGAKKSGPDVSATLSGFLY